MTPERASFYGLVFLIVGLFTIAMFRLDKIESMLKAGTDSVTTCPTNK